MSSGEKQKGSHFVSSSPITFAHRTLPGESETGVLQRSFPTRSTNYFNIENKCQNDQKTNHTGFAKDLSASSLD